jgi:hypothetical protein
MVAHGRPAPDGKRIVFVDTGPTRRINFLDELEDFEDEE